MKRMIWGTSALALAMALSLAADSIGAQDKAPTIKEIMKKAHRPKTGLLPDVGMDLRDDELNWKEIQEHTKELVELGTALGKNDPPKGEKASWAKFTKAYLADAKTLDAAAKKMNKAGALAAHKKLEKSCDSCHESHRPK